MNFGPAVALGAHDGQRMVLPLQLMNAACECFIVVLVAVQTFFGEMLGFFSRKAVPWKQKQEKQENSCGYNFTTWGRALHVFLELMDIVEQQVNLICGKFSQKCASLSTKYY